MTTIVLTKSNLLEILPKILEKIKEGFKVEVKFVNQEAKQKEKDIDIDYILSWEWMDEEDKKIMEEFEKARKKLKPKEIFKKMQQDEEFQKRFEKILENRLVK